MGWYDLFHSSDGPTLYTISNRTSVTYDVSIVAVCILFATLFFAFIVIFPGVRKQVHFLIESQKGTSQEEDLLNGESFLRIVQ